MQGISRLEQFVEELSEEERAKELKQEKKRQKRKNRRKNKCGFDVPADKEKSLDEVRPCRGHFDIHVPHTRALLLLGCHIPEEDIQTIHHCQGSG